jgi:predicted dinucleotide-binding enzyme
MRIAVLGTGNVGRRLATALTSLGHDVTMGSRTKDNAAAAKWAAETGGRHGTFADAAAAGELVVNATAGLGSLAALQAAGADNLRGKVLVDVSNPLDASEGFPPKVLTPDGASLAEQIQRAFPDTRVVKTLNTMTNLVMVDPGRLHADHNVFLSGDHDAAKAEVRDLLREFGWRDAQIIDLGDLSTARGPEAYLTLWLRLMAALGTADFNIAVVRS